MSEVKTVSLGEKVEVISGTHVKSDKVSDDSSKIPYLTGPDDFDEDGFTITKYTEDPPSFCEPGDTLVTVKGSGCGRSTFANKRAGISRQLKALRPVDDLESKYLYYWIQTQEELLSILAQGTSIPGLSISDLTTLQIPLPPLSEQSRISDILSTVDEQIEQTDEIIMETEELKRGVMQDLLIGGISNGSTREIQIGPRVLDIPEHWSMEPCGRLFEAINGRAFKTEEWEEEGTQIIRIQDLRPDAEAETNYASFKVDDKYHVTDGDLLFCWAGNIKTSLGAYIWSGDDAYLNQHIYNLRPERELDKRFFAYSLNKHLRLLKTMVGGSAGQVHITKSDFEAFRLPAPPVEEQKRIADIIQSTEKKVQREKERKDKLQELKRGLMQDLLTGKVRVNTD